MGRKELQMLRYTQICECIQTLAQIKLSSFSIISKDISFIEMPSKLIQLWQINELCSFDQEFLLLIWEQIASSHSCSFNLANHRLPVSALQLFGTFSGLALAFFC